MTMKENITKSLVLASLFPESINGFDALADAIKYVSGRGFSMVEFYSPEGHDREIALMLKENGLDSVFIGVYPLKASKASLCATDEAERSSAVTALRVCIDRAAALGSKSVMINSGFKPACDGDIPSACESYIRSVGEGYDYIREKGYTLEITLEPGDSSVQSFQLLGPAKLTVDTARRIRETNPAYSLTMDVAHIMEEGEDVMESLALTLPYCSHVHLCNCLLSDASHPMYGDKHVDFDYPGACFTYSDFEEMYLKIKRLYTGRDLTVSLEIMCRSADNPKWFDQVAAKTAWLF